jgi:tripartite-type tricarboxylate transporter receptor subunit TctC
MGRAREEMPMASRDPMRVGRRRALGLAAAAGTAALGGAARPARAANGWPTRPVRIVVPFAPGGPSDTHARLVAEHMARALGQPFVVENRAGATGAIGTTTVMRAEPDGHTLLFTTNSSHVLGPLLTRAPAFDPTRDFTDIALHSTFPFYLLVHPALPVRGAGELVAHAKANPGRLNYSSPGIGAGGHLMAELFRMRTGIEATHVPYSGAGPATRALVGGEVQFCFDSVGTAQPLVAEGHLRGLAVTGARRVAAVPEVPTLTEAGISGAEAELWLGLFGPARLPRPVQEALNAELGRYLAPPETRARLAAGAYEPAGGSPEALTARIAGETERWAEVVRFANLQQQG